MYVKVNVILPLQMLQIFEVSGQQYMETLTLHCDVSGSRDLLPTFLHNQTSLGSLTNRLI